MLKWKGTGFLDGIPARDLDDSEVEQYGGKKKLLETGLYEEVRGKPVGKKEGFVTKPDTGEDGKGE